jgi:hypothetical protein
VPVRQLNLSRRFFRQTRFCAFFPLGGGGTRIARRIASSNLIGFSGFKNFGTGISSSEFFPTKLVHSPQWRARAQTDRSKIGKELGIRADACSDPATVMVA